MLTDNLFFCPKDQQYYSSLPPTDLALEDPNGLLAVGGNLDPYGLLNAYRDGIFPWYQDDQPVLWWSPNPRAVILTDSIHISRRLRRWLRQSSYKVTMDVDFDAVIHACAHRGEGIETWLSNDMISAYTELHEMGHAHSIEVWDENELLIGGVYGILLESMFCGESMFSRRTNTSKMALIYLCEWLNSQGISVLDCQVMNPHLQSLGAIAMPRDQFTQQYL